MNRHSIAITLIIALISSTFLIGCGDKRTDAEKFVGTWESVDDESDHMDGWHETVVIFSDGTGYSHCVHETGAVLDCLIDWKMEDGSLMQSFSYADESLNYTTVDKYRYINSDKIELTISTSAAEGVEMLQRAS